MDDRAGTLGRTFGEIINAVVGRLTGYYYFKNLYVHFTKKLLRAFPPEKALS